MSIVTLMDLQATSSGEELLDELVEALKRYVVLPSDAAVDAVALWIAATHAQTAWECAPRLVINSPEKRCGKSRLLDLIELTVHRPLMTMNASTAAIFRIIDETDPPTLLFDEADAIWSSKKSNKDSAEDLRALVNAGFGRGRTTLRCVGPKQVPTRFPTYCMVALAGIGDFAPDTVRDRAVVVTMRRRSTAEPVDTFRSRRDAPQFRELGERLHDWATSRLDALGDARPDMPVEDRAADTWEPLVAVADAAGGSWPARARASCLSLTDEAVSGEAELSSSVRLLLDIRDAFEEAETISMSSENLVTHLRALPDAPWNEWALTPNGLAKRLHRYGVAPDRIPVVNGRQQRGYRSQDFTDAWARYLPPVAPDVEDVTPSSSEVRD